MPESLSHTHAHTHTHTGDNLSGFHVLDRYLIVLYYQPNKQTKKVSLDKQSAQVEQMKAKYNVEGTKGK